VERSVLDYALPQRKPLTLDGRCKGNQGGLLVTRKKRGGFKRSNNISEKKLLKLRERGCEK